MIGGEHAAHSDAMSKNRIRQSECRMWKGLRPEAETLREGLSVTTCGGSQIVASRTAQETWRIPVNNWLSRHAHSQWHPRRTCAGRIWVSSKALFLKGLLSALFPEVLTDLLARCSVIPYVDPPKDKSDNDISSTSSSILSK